MSAGTGEFQLDGYGFDSLEFKDSDRQPPLRIPVVVELTCVSDDGAAVMGRRTYAGWLYDEGVEDHWGMSVTVPWLFYIVGQPAKTTAFRSPPSLSPEVEAALEERAAELRRQCLAQTNAAQATWPGAWPDGAEPRGS